MELLGIVATDAKMLLARSFVDFSLLDACSKQILFKKNQQNSCHNKNTKRGT